jgi:hypothetical protein
MKSFILSLNPTQITGLVTCAVVTGALFIWRVLHAPESKSVELTRCKRDFNSLSSNIQYALWTQYNFYEEQIDDFLTEFKGKVEDQVLTMYTESLRKQLRARMFLVRPLAVKK